MNLFKQEFKEEKEEFDVIDFKNQRKSLKVSDQVGRTNVKRDIKRDALSPGKRISKSGKTYWETRKNRSDAPGKKI